MALQAWVGRLAGWVSTACACLLGAWLAGVLPVQIQATHREAANAAAGRMPEMAPGTVTALAVVLLAIPLATIVLAELARCMTSSAQPLGAPAAFALGALAAWPVGATFTVRWLSVGLPGLLLESILGLAVFYTARRAWLRRRQRAMVL